MRPSYPQAIPIYSRYSPIQTADLTPTITFSLCSIMAVETLGDAFSAGWRIKIRCAWGPRDGMKRVRECIFGGELDLQTLIWTRGSAFPLTMLENRLKCPRCGSRRVRVAFSVPPDANRRQISA